MRIAIDFDGTIVKWDGEWTAHGEFGELIPGAKENINSLYVKGNTIIINTCRLEIHQIKAFLLENGIHFDYINFSPETVDYPLHPAKVLADVYIDDKAIKFEGNWDETANDIENFKEWWRKGDK